MGNESMKPENTSDAPEERSEQGKELQDLQDLQPGRLSQSAQPNTVPEERLKSALKKNKAWFVVRDQVEKKEVRFNLAELEMRDEDPMSPPAPGYGVKFLETLVWPGQGVDQVEVTDVDAPPTLPDSANSPDAANTPVAGNTPDAARDAANSESKE